MKSQRIDQIVNRRIMLWMGSVAIIVLLISIGTMVNLFHSTDHDEVATEINDVHLLLESEKRLLEGALLLGGDESYDFTQAPGTVFEADELTEIHRSLAIHFTVIMAAPNHVLLATESSADNIGETLPVLTNKALLPILNTLPEWQTGFSPGKIATSFYMVGDRPTMITLTGLRDEADDDSNEQVMVIMGRFIDGEYLAWLEQITGSRIQLSSIQSEHEQSFNGLVEVLTSQALVHSTGQNIWLQVGRSFDWKPRLLQLFFILLAIVSVLTLGSWAVQRSLRHLVVSRIEKFSALARTSDAGDNIMYWPNEGKTELDDLAGAFNNVVKRLNNSKLNLQHQAETDYLTGLNNRHALETRLNQMVGESCKPSLLLMDLDGFKLINDSLGHAAGDYLLQQVALRLCDSMRHNDAIFRIGGDEFVAIFPHTDTSLASALAKRLLQSLEEPILYQDHTLKVSASIGIAQWQDNISGSELMRFADLAMYAAKHDGKARIRCFEEKMNIGIREQFCFEQAFRKALAERRIEAWFQPILDTQTNVIIAVELLARWQHQGQMIAPLTFIRLAEELGLIANLSELLLEQGLTELAQLRRQIPELKLHINISALQFTDHMLAHKILAHIRKHQLPSSAIVIELTETALLRYPEQVDDILKVFDNAHVCMQLDNFGTGYSSISHLNSLPFDAIKLDRSFVEKLNHADTSLTKAIYDLAHNLGLNLVAEGVENNIEYTSLKEIGYQHMQGYLFAKPMDIDKLHPWISAYLQPNNTELTSTKTSFSSTKPSAPLQTS